MNFFDPKINSGYRLLMQYREQYNIGINALSKIDDVDLREQMLPKVNYMLDKYEDMYRTMIRLGKMKFGTSFQTKLDNQIKQDAEEQSDENT